MCEIFRCLQIYIGIFFKDFHFLFPPASDLWKFIWRIYFKKFKKFEGGKIKFSHNQAPENKYRPLKWSFSYLFCYMQADFLAFICMVRLEPCNNHHFNSLNANNQFPINVHLRSPKNPVIVFAMRLNQVDTQMDIMQTNFCADVGVTSNLYILFLFFLFCFAITYIIL